MRGLRACVALITVALLLGACGNSARPESADQPPAVSRNADPTSTSRPAARHPPKPISVIPKLYAVRTEARAVALTFDDGPDPRNTPQILDLLARYQVHATFFVLGSAAKHYPGIVRRSAAGGNEIGNHGWTHLHMTNLNEEQLSDQITRDANLITRLTSQRPTSFRPPYGDVNQTVVEVANALGETVLTYCARRARKRASHCCTLTASGVVWVGVSSLSYTP